MEALHQPGDIIAERYRITGTLGQGGVGITYAAQDLKSGQQVALKALSLRQMGDWKVLELFEREAKILAQLNHPAIPRYLDYFQVDTPEDRGFYIAQELAEGKSLADLVEIGWRTNESGVRKIAAQVLEILIYLHELKPPVIHRDIKPHNLIWGQNAKVFLVDFGAVQDTYRSTFAKGSTIVGTYGFMAPEQFLGQAVPATDLYGLGATLLFLLTHRSPSDLPQERLKIKFRSRIQVSEQFADWLEKMLEPDEENRFSSAKDALKALRGRRVVAKSRLSVPWKALVGVGVAAVATVAVLNSFKWTILNTLGLQPDGICEALYKGDSNPLRNYLNQGGNPYAVEANMAVASESDLTVLDCAITPMFNRAKPDQNLRKLMITKIPNVHARDNKGKTPLHYAAYFGFKDIVERLIAKGADVNAKDNEGITPLYRVHTKEVAQLLIAKGADVNAKNNHGITPLHWVHTKEVAQLLIAKGADVDVKDSEGCTPLHRVHTKEVAQLLIAKGADVNAKNNEGMTPIDKQFQTASLLGEDIIDVVGLLLAKGGQLNINAVSDHKETPLHVAASLGHKNIVELLLIKGAKVNVEDESRLTPLDWATVKHYTNVVKLLRSHNGIGSCRNLDALQSVCKRVYIRCENFNGVNERFCQIRSYKGDDYRSFSVKNYK